MLQEQRLVGKMIKPFVDSHFLGDEKGIRVWPFVRVHEAMPVDDVASFMHQHGFKLQDGQALDEARVVDQRDAVAFPADRHGPHPLGIAPPTGDQSTQKGMVVEQPAETVLHLLVTVHFKAPAIRDLKEALTSSFMASRFVRQRP